MTEWFADPITHPYIDHYEAGVFDTPHFAVDIGTPFHSQITALLPGTIVKEDFQPWGGEMFIKPDDTSKPEYYYFHLDDFNIGPNQHVNAGDVIGLSGGQTSGGDHPVTDGESTGPHTHVGWFDGYVTPSETGFTIPHGPDITPLINQVNAHGISSGGLINVSAIVQPDPYPGGAINPLNWPNEIQTSSQNANAQVASDIVNWVNTKIGPFLLRVAVGSVGIGLIFFGAREVADSLKSIPQAYQKVRGSTRRAKSQSKKKPAAKTSEKKPKTSAEKAQKTVGNNKKPEKAADKAEKTQKVAEKATKAEKTESTAETVAEVAA
jgi:Sec-independent protein translocase protein TatA